MERSWNKFERRRSQRESYQDDELAQLEAQFRNAYTMKALEAQLAEKQAEQMARETEEKLSQNLIFLEELKLAEEDTRRCLEVTQARVEYKKILEDQIATKVEAKRQEEAVAREERKLLAEVDELMDKVHELAKKKHRDCTVERLKRERLLFEEIREIKKVIKEEEDAIAAERDLLYLEEVERRSREVRKLQANQIKRREELIEAVARLFVDTTLEKCEREAVIGELVAEELRHEAIIEEKEREEKIKIKNKEIAKDLMDQMLFTAECETRACERDRIFTQQLMTQLMKEDEKMSRLTAEAKKRKQQQYKEDLEKLISQRKFMREEAVTQARAELNESRAREQAKRQRIKVERRRLIEEHAGNVATYLRNGILTQEEENIVQKLLEKCKDK